MNWLLLAVIALCLAGVMACEDIVTGDYPIERVGNTVFCFPQPADDYRVSIWKGGASVSVTRPFDEGVTIDFHEYFPGEILTAVIIKAPGGDE